MYRERCLTSGPLEISTTFATITFTCGCCRRRSTMGWLAAFRSQSFSFAQSQEPDRNSVGKNASCRSDGQVPHCGLDGSGFSIRHAGRSRQCARERDPFPAVRGQSHGTAWRGDRKEDARHGQGIGASCNASDRHWRHQRLSLHVGARTERFFLDFARAFF